MAHISPSASASSEDEVGNKGKGQKRRQRRRTRAYYMPASVRPSLWRNLSGAAEDAAEEDAPAWPEAACERGLASAGVSPGWQLSALPGCARMAARFPLPSTPNSPQYSIPSLIERGCSQSKYVAAKMSSSPVRSLRSCAAPGRANSPTEKQKATAKTVRKPPVNRACRRSPPASPSIPRRGRTPCGWGPCPGAGRPRPQTMASDRRTAGRW